MDYPAKERRDIIDNQILDDAKKGDIPAFEMLVYRYERLLFSVAFRMMGSQMDAEDMVQESFLRIYRKIESCHHIDVFKAWACTITTHICIDELRKRQIRPTLSYDNPIHTEEGVRQREFPDTNPLPEEAVLEKEGFLEIEKALLSINHDQREMVILRDVEGFTYEEIVEATNIKLGTVKSRINRGRKQMADFLSNVHNPSKQ